MKRFLKVMLLVSIVGFIAYEGVQWTVNRVYVPEGHSLWLRYKGPLVFGKRVQAKLGHFAKEGEIGILGNMRGPGRHFYCPVWWERYIVKDLVVLPGNVAIMESKLGEELPKGQFLVDGKLGETNHKGILRKAYGPGTYRVHPYAYTYQIQELTKTKDGNQTKYSGWVDIPTGYVGVVTNLTNNPITGAVGGVQPDVLPPGIYPINGQEQQIDIVEIGYREATVSVTKKKNADKSIALDKNGEPIVADSSTGINFPSNDGFDIAMDYTAIWGVMPKSAPDIIKTFGNVTAVEDKVVYPQIESICRNNGSTYSAVELLVGEDRQKFQDQTSQEFHTILKDKNIDLLMGLVRHIYIPTKVREPIQTKFISDELKLTRDQEKQTAKEEATLRETERSVQKEAEQVNAETRKLVAKKKAEGDKTADSTRAETEKLVAAIDRKTAEVDAQAKVVLGEAEAISQKLQAEAKSDKFRLAVEAFGTAEAYNKWIFASNLPTNVKLRLIYAGQGTLWTDLDGGLVEKLMGKNEAQLQDKQGK